MESRQYPVSIHFNRRTQSDYLKECFYKTCKIHTKLPEGGILVFVTGQQEVRTLVNKLKSTFPSQDKGSKNTNNKTDKESKKFKKMKTKKKGVPVEMPGIDLDK